MDEPFEADHLFIGRETVANWMLLRGYATGHGDTIQDLLFELEGQLGGQKEPPPGEGDFQVLRQTIKSLRAALTDLCDAWDSEDGGKYSGNVTRANDAARAILADTEGRQ